MWFDHPRLVFCINVSEGRPHLDEIIEWSKPELLVFKDCHAVIRLRFGLVNLRGFQDVVRNLAINGLSIVVAVRASLALIHLVLETDLLAVLLYLSLCQLTLISIRPVIRS